MDPTQEARLLNTETQLRYVYYPPEHTDEVMIAYRIEIIINKRKQSSYEII